MVNNSEEKVRNLMWYEKIIEGLTGPQIINDSKTPSGRVHVGSLRGVLIHDAIYRALLDGGTEVTYQYGVDDYDPLDGLPADGVPSLQEYMGCPLCNIPAPAGSKATDLADHYIAEFLDIFKELGVGAQVYRMRDIYRSGRFNEAIDTILKKSDVVRKIYADLSHADRPDNWHPFQVICENCGKIGTTQVTAYDGEEVTYQCREDLVSWARGCGCNSKVSPFDGNGKLPWKLEWAAKWHTFGIT
ncbi:MAG: lysine--tRNA ligase, partial [Methylococcales bacterium]